MGRGFAVKGGGDLKATLIGGSDFALGPSCLFGLDAPRRVNVCQRG